MHYLSTRAIATTAATAATASFSDILLAGLADDGGLYLPQSYPQVSAAELDAWRSLSYAELAFQILRKFATDIAEEDLHNLVLRTYRTEVYCNARPDEDASQITPLRVLRHDQANVQAKTADKSIGKTLFLQGLSNGPTLAFKDMAMQLLGNLFEYTLDKHQQELNILGATSGDTGSAAEYAMRGKRGIRVFMLSPHQKMSAFQTAQMFSLQEQNIHNIAVKGVFDDCQDMVKAVSNDLPFKTQYRIGTVNSINWARIVAQVVYYFRGYLAATTSSTAAGGPQKVSFTVPSGNFGNICAGHIARMMGLPIDKLVVATNENDVLHDFFTTGVYRVRASEETWHTSSPSMDISKASNFERFIFDLLGRDGARVKALFQQVESKGGFDLSGQAGSDGDEFAKIAQFGFQSGKSTHQDRLDTIRRVQHEYGIVVDPHTADGLKVAEEFLVDGVPMIVLETALPTKFNDTIREALGCDAERPAGFADLETLPQRFDVMDADSNAIKHYIQSHLDQAPAQ